MYIEEVCPYPKRVSIYLQVCVYQDTYQFAYFLRESEPYSVLLKVSVAHIDPKQSHHKSRSQETSFLLQKHLSQSPIPHPQRRRKKQASKKRALPERKGSNLKEEAQSGRTAKMKMITSLVIQDFAIAMTYKRIKTKISRCQRT